MHTRDVILQYAAVSYFLLFVFSFLALSLSNIASTHTHMRKRGGKREILTETYCGTQCVK